MPLEVQSPALQESLDWLTNTVEQVIDETLHLCRIPAPTFAEAARAAYVAERMRAIGLAEVQVDALHNVVGSLGRATERPTTLVVAHLDTVFPATTPLTVRRTQRRLYGPGIGDNCVGVAALLRVAEAMHRLRPWPGGRVLFAASVGEEGLGNLCGIRALLERWGDQIETVLAVEGHGVDEVRHVAIGSTRLEVVFQGPGGHSWGAFGTPSAIHAMGTAIHTMARLRVPHHPKTTLNIGLVEGGESVNTIASSARLLIDLRSIDAVRLRRLEQRVLRLLEGVARQAGLRLTTRIVGQRPAAALDASHPLLQGIGMVRKHLRLRPASFREASTDANLPLSQGIPAVCLGITRGEGTHTVHEYIEIASIQRGLKQLLLTILHTLRL